MDFYDDGYGYYEDGLSPGDNYPAEGRPVPPTSARSGRFTLATTESGGEAFEIDGHLILLPAELEPLQNQGKGLQVDKAMTKPWILAQLECYGVNFKKSASKPILTGLLENLINSGKVRRQQVRYHKWVRVLKPNVIYSMR
jgi:hypothetical protein